MAKIFIGIPNIGNVRSELAERLLSLNSYGHTVAIYFSQKRPIDSNRNHIVNEFLKTDCTHLIMIDSDVVPSEDFIKVIENDVDICSCNIATNRGGEIIQLGMTKVKDGYRCEKLILGLNEVDATGTGCLCVKREVLEAMNKPYFQFIYKDGVLVNGEDFNFCEKAKELGFKVYFDTRYKCFHYQLIPF